ncbi:protein isoform X2 [Capsicum galapagoense]
MEDVSLGACGRKIPRVPLAMLQMEFEDLNPTRSTSEYCSDYSPMVVSIGPYHHGKPELQGVQNFKQELLDLFISGGRTTDDSILEDFMEHIDIARSYYMEGSVAAYSKEELAKMMLLDACFIISVNDTDTAKKISSRLGKLVLSLAFRDILLLENQIPFWFVKRFWKIRQGPAYANWWIKNFICRVIYGNHRNEAGDIGSDNDLPLFLLEALRRAIVAGTWTKSYKPKHHDDYGIYFKPGKTGLVNDIKFKSFCFYGRVELPTFIVTNRSRVWLKNIIAYEMSPGTNVGLEVISYINFMKSIINDPKDVQELRDKRILINRLNSDDEVVKLFKEINTCGLDDDQFVLRVKERIQKHYNNKAKTWMSELIITHFLTPWKALALLAAIFILFLTASQTYFTVFPRD